MKPILKFLSLILLCAAVAGGAVHAESSPEAAKYLSTLSDVAENRAFEADYAIQGSSSAMGQPVKVDISGRVMQSNRRNMRTTMEMTMTMTPAQGEEMQMTMSSLQVADGTTMWTEMDNPMMGGKQVMKIGLDQLAADPDSAFQRQMSALDPVSQMRRLVTLFDFNVAGREEGKVTLSAEITPEGLSEMGISPDVAANVSSFSIDIDEKTGFVDEVRVSGEEPVLVMRVSGFKALEPGEIDPEQFSYTPPSGVQVTDLTAGGGG